MFIYLIKNNSANQEFFLRCLFKQLFSSNSKKETLFTKPYEFDLAINTFHYYYRIFHFVVIFLRLIDFHLMHFSIFWLNQLLILISFFFASHSSSNASLLFNHLFLFTDYACNLSKSTSKFGSGFRSKSKSFGFRTQRTCSFGPLHWQVP